MGLDTSLVHGQQFCEILSRSNLAVRSYGSDMDFWKSSFVEFCTAVSEEKSKMSQPIRGQGDHFVFPIGPKNTNLVEDASSLAKVPIRLDPPQRIRTLASEDVQDVEILLPIKFRSIPISGFSSSITFTTVLAQNTLTIRLGQDQVTLSFQMMLY